MSSGAITSESLPDQERRVSGENTGSNKIRQEMVRSSVCMSNCKAGGSGWTRAHRPQIARSEGEAVGDDSRAYAVVFEESFKLQDALIHQRASGVT